MSFETEVPAQRDAVAYAQHVAAAIDLPLIVGGHSKGGNLAAYAGMFVVKRPARAFRRSITSTGRASIEANDLFRSVWQGWICAFARSCRNPQ